MPALNFFAGKEEKRTEVSKHNCKEEKGGEHDIMKQIRQHCPEGTVFSGSLMVTYNSLLQRKMCGPSQGNADNATCI